MSDVPSSESSKLSEIPHPGIKHISIEEIKALRLKGLSCSQIAAILKCNKSNIVRRLQGIIFSRNELREVGKNLPDIKLSDYMRYRSYITDDKLKKAGASELAKMVSFKYNEYRIEMGLSTENISIKTLNLSLSDIEKEISKLEGVKG